METKCKANTNEVTNEETTKLGKLWAQLFCELHDGLKLGFA
jgi:hypothetical protein